MHSLSSWRHPKRKLPYGELFSAGLIASSAVLLLSAAFTLVSAPITDFGDLYGRVVSGGSHVVPSQPSWWIGLILHFLWAAFVVPVWIDYLISHQVFPQRKWIRIMLISLSLWLSIEAVFKPLLGFGFFSSGMAGRGASGLSLILCLLYAAVLDAFCQGHTPHRLKAPIRGERTAA